MSVNCCDLKKIDAPKRLLFLLEQFCRTACILALAFALALELSLGFYDQFCRYDGTQYLPGRFYLNAFGIDTSFKSTLYEELLRSDFPSDLAVFPDGDRLARADSPLKLSVYKQVAFKVQFALESSTFGDDGGTAAGCSRWVIAVIKDCHGTRFSFSNI